MNSSGLVLSRATRLSLLSTVKRQSARYSNTHFTRAPPRRRDGKLIGLAAVLGVAAAGTYYYFPHLVSLGANSFEGEPRPTTKLQFEQPLPEVSSDEAFRDLVSPQHAQIKKSLEHPGVYAWGSNAGKVIDPASDEKYIKLPRRIAYFDDQLLSDLKLTSSFGAAISENGDLVQWGVGFSEEDPTPRTTLRGKNLAKIEVSADRIIALSRSGSVYSIPVARDDVEEGFKQDVSSKWWSLWSTGKEKTNFRDLTPSNLGWGERVTDVSSGLEHALILTSKGRVFAAASSTAAYPSKGQMGIPGLSWTSRPAGPYDQPHEIKAFSELEVKQVATGNYHSAVLDKAGRLFTFGDNTFGQLGFDPSGTQAGKPPRRVATGQLYSGSGLVPTITSIAAGGDNTYFTVDAEVAKMDDYDNETAVSKKPPRATSDLWAVGQGTYGTLGTGKWQQVSGTATKVKSLSSLYEFDDKSNSVRPIKIRALPVGATHCAAVMDNATRGKASSKTSASETNWGSDVLFWGGNEHYQLGTGKRANINAPTYIGALDGGEADADKGRAGAQQRMCLAPRQTARLGENGKGRRATVEQRVECGRFVSGVYSAV